MVAMLIDLYCRSTIPLLFTEDLRLCENYEIASYAAYGNCVLLVY